LPRNKRIFIEDDYPFEEKKRQLLGIFRAQQSGELAAAGAIAGEHRNFVPFFLLAAFRNDMPVMFVRLFFQKAATGVVGPPLRRTAADVAVARALPGYGAGNARGRHGKRRKGTHVDNHVDYREEQSYYVTGLPFHAANTTSQFLLLS
jgi:hypothetical protein